MVSRSVVVLAATAFLASCEDNTTGTPLTPPPASTAVDVTPVEPVGGYTQEQRTMNIGGVDTTVTVVSPDPVFSVVYPDATPGAGQIVTFDLNLPGIIGQERDTVDAAGLVSPGSWILGPRCGTQRLVAAPASGNTGFIDVAPTPQLFLWHVSGTLLEPVNDTCGIFSAGTGQNVNVIEVTGLTYDAAAGLLVGGDIDGTVVTIDPATGTETVLGPVGGSSWLGGLAFEQGAAPRLLGVMQGNGNLYSVNLTTGAATSLGAMTLVGQTIQGATGLATDPTTGTIYGILRLMAANNLSRTLVTINPTTLVVTAIGALGQDGMADLAFSADGTLYGVTGDGGDPAATLFTIDKTNAATTQFLALGNGGFGEAIAAVP
jgi:hypothetical protein